jgi:predicted amidohydrolase
MRILIKVILSLLFLPVICNSLFAQNSRIARIAVIQANESPRQGPSLENFDHSKVRPQMMYHFNKLLGLFKEAGEMGADMVCGPEDMQHIGQYGFHVDLPDPETGKILAEALATTIPGPLTNKVAEIARKYGMYIIAPIYEAEGGKVFNSAVVFDRDGCIIGKHRKTILPPMEGWLVSTGDEFEIFKTDFANVAIATCWELFFPEIPTIYALKGADIIFNPTMARNNKPGQSLDTAPMLITRARDNSVYIVPVVLGSDGNGIIDFNGNILAEAPGMQDTVIMTDIDFSKERISDSRMWELINGTNNERALLLKSRRPELFKLITDPNPPLMERYTDIRLTPGDRERQLDAIEKLGHGSKNE